MKKIMFNDKYGMTKAVLEGTKWKTRRIIPDVHVIRHFNPRLFPENRDPSAYYRDLRGMCRLINSTGDYILPKYDIGEIVAVAQSYKECGWGADVLQETFVKKPTIFPDIDPITPHVGWIDLPFKYHKGWNNKMFVSAELMPNKIEITSIKAELLQDISDEDCIAEGVIKWMDGYIVTGIMENRGKNNVCFNTPREAFACLIDRICGKGTWESNPFVFAYEYKLVQKKEVWQSIE